MAPSVDAGKKRKRQTDGASKPSKRVAIDDGKDISIRLQESDEWAPVIAFTPGLSLPTSLALQPYTRSRPQSSKNTSKSTIATKELLLRSEDDSKLLYTGKEEEADEEDGADSLEPYLKHYVGVYNPDTGALDVMEARSMVVRGIVRAHQPQVKDLIAMNHRDQKNALGQAFGTKKAKKAILAVTENAISPTKANREASGDGPLKLDPAAAAMLANMATATSSMATKAELDAAMNAAKPRPYANVETSDITQVYTIDSLIGKESMAALQVRQWQVDMKAGKNVQVTSRFVANRLLKFRDNVEKLKMLRYILLLLDFYNNTTPTREGRKLKRPDDLKLILSNQPESLLTSIKRKFTEGPIMSRHNSDLLITHICAISLVLENYELDTWDLKEDLKLELNPMCQYFKEIGAKVGSVTETFRKAAGMDKANAGQRRLARLKVPLEFPTTKFVRSRR